MKKKLLCVLLSTAMVTALLAGCSGEKEGQTLNICVWNDEFQTRFIDYYPGYEITDETTKSGKIGDVTVNWFVYPNEGANYQDNLDRHLQANADASADEIIDLYCIEADYALKYVNSDYSMNLADLGITAADLSDQYKYTQDIVTDANGALKGSSWQACSALLIYNRAIAKEVLGTDDPAEVQTYVSDWDTYNDTAAKIAEAGYLMTASVNDTYRTFSNNVSKPWVDADGNLSIDANIEKWIDMSAEQVANGYTTTNDLWGDDWAKGFYNDEVFCYFGPAWFIDFSMKVEEPTSIAANGGWGAVAGPQGYYWGGTWVCAATGTDNEELVKDVILTMTADTAILEKIVTEKRDCVNSKTVLEKFAADTSYKNDVLGGQNPYALFSANLESINLQLSAYDQVCNEKMQSCMKNYFAGNATKEEALSQFYKSVKEAYPSLNVPE